jgi:ATP-dependent Lon protease
MPDPASSEAHSPEASSPLETDASTGTPEGAQSYEALMREVFSEVAIDKAAVRRLKLEGQGVPTFVAEWLVSREKRRRPEATDEELRDAVYQFVREHLPRKRQKEALRNRLHNGETLKILDHFRASIDLRRDRKRIHVPSLDETGEIDAHVADQQEGLLEGGMWGAGKLVYESPDRSETGEGTVWLRAFEPLQAAAVDLDYYCEQRARFSTRQWLKVLLNSMGYNPDAYAGRRQIRLLTRLLPLVQKRVNLMELAPKGTGKSFMFSNLSRYARVISGGKTSPAVLFYNLNTKTPGLLTRYDAVVFDEAQTISFDQPGEVIGVLKDYMESGRFTRGDKHATSGCGIVFLGNIEIGPSGTPASRVLFDELPDFLGEPAFIDRIHGILPGWQLPKIQNNSPARSLGLKADYFSKILQELRGRGDYEGFVREHSRITGDGSEIMRNRKAVERLAAGYLKLFFPDLNVEPEAYETYCLAPAIDLRERVCRQLHLLDRGEYEATSLDGVFKE